MTEEMASLFEAKRKQYIDTLKPLFLPDDPVSNDIVNYFASLLRVFGMEDAGWDPYAESRATVEDLTSLLEVGLQENLFPDLNATRRRLALLLYCHIVEMDAPHEVLTNLLRFRLGKSYTAGAFFDLLTAKEQKSFWTRGVPTDRKIKILKTLSVEAGLADVGAIFDDFYDNRLRNAVAHSDYILTEGDFRCRGKGTKAAFCLSYESLDRTLTSARAFATAFFQLELIARRCWGLKKQQGLPYDPVYKGLLEILVDGRDAMCGFRLLWPNKSQSIYRRTEGRVQMINCSVNASGGIDFMVGQYAEQPGAFSPLVAHDADPVYAKLEDSSIVPTWPTNANAKTVP